MFLLTCLDILSESIQTSHQHLVAQYAAKCQIKQDSIDSRNGSPYLRTELTHKAITQNVGKCHQGSIPTNKQDNTESA